jgi:hypothetical protein
LPSGIFTIHEHPEFFCFHPSVWTCIYRRDFIEEHRIRVEEIPGAGWTDNLFQIQTLCLAKSITYVDTAFYHWRLKQNDDAKDLKDVTIPFLRTRTIHAWLRENNITNENIWACLHKRELRYMHIVLRAAKYRELLGLRPLFREMLSDMNPKIIENNQYITRSDRRRYRRLYNTYHGFYYKLRMQLGKTVKKIRAFTRSCALFFWLEIHGSTSAPK